MATALPAVFLPSDFERLALSSVAGDAEEGVRRFDALESLLLGAADPAARGIDACTAVDGLRCQCRLVAERRASQRWDVNDVTVARSFTLGAARKSE